MAKRKSVDVLEEEWTVEENNEKEEKTNETILVDTNSTPRMGSPEWSDYVMSHFTPEELDNGYPKVDGLRRVAQNLLGEIVFSGIQQIFPSSESSTIGRVTVVYAIEFAWSYGVELRHRDLSAFDYPLKRFSDVSDAWSGNAEYKYAVHTASLAATKAEARVLRKALQLRTIAAEEMNTTKLSDIPDSDNEGISEKQYAVVQSKCDQLSIDMLKLAVSIGLANNPLKWTKGDGAKLISKINKIQTEEEKISEDVKK
jgi:hypothetical protein